MRPWMALLLGNAVAACGAADDPVAPDAPSGAGGGEPSCHAFDLPEESACGLGDAIGIFVANEGDDADAGTKAQPVATLAHAITLARAQKKRVYACAQTFAE